MPDNQNPGQTTTNQINVLTQSFNTLQTIINYGQAAVDSKSEPNDRFALQSDLNSISGKANDLQKALNELKGDSEGSVKSQIATALGSYAEITKNESGTVGTISMDSDKYKASFVSPSVYANSGDIVALAYGKNITVNGDGTFVGGSFSAVKPTNANQMLVSTTGGRGLEFRAIPTAVTTNIAKEDGKALVDINVAANDNGDSAVISGTHSYFVNKIETSGTGNVVTSAGISNNVLTVTKGTTVISSVEDSSTGESDNQNGDVAIKSISKSGSALSYATTKVVTPNQLTSQLNDYWQKFDADDAAGSNSLKDYIDKTDKDLGSRIDVLEDAVGSDGAGGSLASRVKTLETNYSTLTGDDSAAKLSDYMKKDAITISVSNRTLIITVKE